MDEGSARPDDSSLFFFQYHFLVIINNLILTNCSQNALTWMATDDHNSICVDDSAHTDVKLAITPLTCHRSLCFGDYYFTNFSSTLIRHCFSVRVCLVMFDINDYRVFAVA